MYTVKKGKDPPYKRFYQEIPKWAYNLRTFGEIGIVSDQRSKKTRGKLKDRGFPCMFVGYPKDHAADTYKMFNLQTKKVIMSRNIIWLNKFYSEYKKTEYKKVIEIYDEDEDEKKKPAAQQQESPPPVTPS